MMKKQSAIKESAVNFTEGESQRLRSSIQSLMNDYMTLANIEYGEKLNRMTVSEFNEKVKVLVNNTESVLLRESYTINELLESAADFEKIADDVNYDREKDPYFKAYMSLRGAIKVFAMINEHRIQIAGIIWAANESYVKLVNELKKIDVEKNKLDVEKESFKTLYEQVSQMMISERERFDGIKKQYDELAAKTNKQMVLIQKQCDGILKELQEERHYNKVLLTHFLSLNDVLKKENLEVDEKVIQNLRERDYTREQKVVSKIKEIKEIVDPEESEVEVQVPQEHLTQIVTDTKPFLQLNDLLSKLSEEDKQIQFGPNVKIAEIELELLSKENTDDIVVTLYKRYNIKSVSQMLEVFKYLKKQVSQDEIFETLERIKMES